MRKKKQSKAVHNPETLKPIEEEEANQENGKEQKGFFACYLLTSLCPRYKGHTYVGFTVNPCRRIRQHNGEIRCGAWRTKKRRPWEMVLCIYGFPTNVSALQFEWAWQHPTESLAVRQAAATFKSFSGVANKIKLAYTMLNLPIWQSLSITVNYFSTKYSTRFANCPSLPEHMKVQVCSMDELPCYTERDESLLGDADGLVDEDWDEASNNSGSLEETLGDVMINLSENFSCSNDDASYERCGQFKQCGNDQPRDSSSLAKTASSIATSNSTRETAEDTDVFGCNTNELDWQRSEQVDIVVNVNNQQLWPREKQSTTNEVGNKDKQNVHSSTAFQNIEVIDLLTPSPSCRIMSCGKKRKISSSPVIIDLT